MKKKLFSLSLVLISVLSFTGCANPAVNADSKDLKNSILESDASMDQTGCVREQGPEGLAAWKDCMLNRNK